MLRKLRAYLESRLRDPVAWIAIPFLFPWVAAAVFEVSPFPMLNGVFFAVALAEWLTIGLWRRREERLRREALEALAPALDRWKPVAVGVVGLLTIALELWTDSLNPSFLGYGLTALGVSSLVTLWYAWSRPLLVTERGIVVGASLVPWSGVRCVVVEAIDAGSAARVEFARPHFFYGTKLRVAATPSQIDRIEALLHKRSSSRVRVEELGHGTA